MRYSVMSVKTKFELQVVNCIYARQLVKKIYCWYSLNCGTESGCVMQLL